MRAVADEIDVIRDIVAASDAAPSLRDDGADAGLSDGFEDELGEGFGVVDDNGAEANVDWRRAGLEEGGEVCGGRVLVGEGEE